MADVSDVLSAIVNTIAAAIYPNGTGQASATGLPAAIYPGWPQSSQLDADMAGFTNGMGGKIHVTVFPLGREKNTTRYPKAFAVSSTTAPTLTMTVSGQTVTVGGVVSTPQNVAIIASNQAYTYAVQSGDTPNTIAAALAAQISGATVSGAVITLPSTYRISAARAGCSGSMAAMTKQQQRAIQITVWADTPAHRDATAPFIDSALSNIDFLTFPDGTSGRLIYESSPFDDMTQKANVYRRDLIYTVDWTTLVAASATEVIVAEQVNHLTHADGSTATLSTTYQ